MHHIIKNLNHTNLIFAVHVGAAIKEETASKEDADSDQKKVEDPASVAKIMTRSRNPNYKPPPPKSSPYLNYSTTANTTTATANKSDNSGDSVLVINAKGEIRRVDGKYFVLFVKIVF